MVGRGAPGIVARDVWRVPMRFSAKFNLGAGISVILPVGIYLIGIYCDHVNFADVFIETLIDGGWSQIIDTHSGAGYDPRVQAQLSTWVIGIPSDGVTLRIRNNNVAATNNIIYVYVDA